MATPGTARRAPWSSVLVATILVAVVAVPAAAYTGPTIEADGPRSDASPVRPPAGSSIENVSRDCGFSVELRDGRSLWIFCDSVGGEGPDWWIKRNTAAVATPGQPTTVREPLQANGRPYQFVLPTGHNPCGDDPFIIWPTSATVQPDGPRDRVIVYYENVCQTGPPDITGVETVGIGVAELHVTPGENLLDGPNRATVLNPELWSGSARQFGRAAVHRGDHVFVYQCDWQWGPPLGCRVGRVADDRVQDPGSYQFWNGSAWVPGRDRATFVEMPGDNVGVAYQVTWVEEWEVFALSHISWPGIGTSQLVRIARSPNGPWSEPISIPLPGCGPDPHWCYAGGIHSQLTDDQSVGLSYYDPTSPFPNGSVSGQVHAFTQPVAIEPGDPVTFLDVLPSHPFFAEIEWMSTSGVTDGYGDATFRPTQPVTRQAMAAFLHRLAGSPPGPFPNPDFTDVPPDHPFRHEIAWMATTGITDGYPDGSFGDVRDVLRQAMAAFLMRFDACCG